MTICSASGGISTAFCRRTSRFPRQLWSFRKTAEKRTIPASPCRASARFTMVRPRSSIHLRAPISQLRATAPIQIIYRLRSTLQFHARWREVDGMEIIFRLSRRIRSINSKIIYLQKAAVKSDIHMPLLQQLFISSTDFLLPCFLLLFFRLLSNPSSSWVCKSTTTDSRRSTPRKSPPHPP